MDIDLKQDAINRWKAATGSDREPVWLLKPGEASRHLGLIRSRVYALMATNELPSITIGRSRRLCRVHLLKWLDERIA